MQLFKFPALRSSFPIRVPTAARSSHTFDASREIEKSIQEQIYGNALLQDYHHARGKVIRSGRQDDDDV